MIVGLITPIVTNADHRGLVDLNNKIKDLATRARDGKLKPEVRNLLLIDSHKSAYRMISPAGISGRSIFCIESRHVRDIDVLSRYQSSSGRDFSSGSRN